MSSAAALIETWVKGNGLPVLRASDSARVSVTFDSVRAHLTPLPGNLLLVEARLCDLPAAASARDKILERALEISLGRLKINAASVTVDDSGTALWLQRRLAATTPIDDLDAAVEALVNEIELWRDLL